MEIQEVTPQVDYIARFQKLPVGGLMMIPASQLQVIADDFGFVRRYSVGPLEVYGLQDRKQDGSIEKKIYIADGNQRYFVALREARLQAILERRPFDPACLMLEVRKVIPHPDNDIRHIWNATNLTDLE